MTNKKLKQFTKTLNIDKPILGISYLQKLPTNFQYYNDTACTALARAFIKNKILVFGSKKYPQLCPGGNYFLKLTNVKDSKAINVYVKNEHVFKNKNICQKFIKSLPKFPEYLKNKHIVIKHFQPRDKPKIVIILVKPAQVGRIIGLMNYKQYNEIKIHPNQPTCLAFFAPLATGSPHLNFIDYYDRYYQGKIHNKYIWPENKMLISMKFKQFQEILDNLDKSPQGLYKKVNIKVSKVDNIFNT